MSLAPGTIVEGSADPRTVEQNAALRGLQTAGGEVGSQYAGSLILPDGTITRDLRYLTKPPARSAEIDAVLNAAGRANSDGTVSGGYLLFLNTDGIPIQYYGCSAEAAQTNAERAVQTVLSPADQSGGITHRAAIDLAARGVQTDGTPVTSSYLDLIETWARQEGIPFSRPSATTVAMLDRPVPPAVVTSSGQGIAAVPAGVALASASGIREAPPMDTPIFTAGAVLPEDFTPAVLRSPTNVATQPTDTMPTMLAANSDTAPATDVATEDASVAAARTRTYLIIGGILAAALIFLGLGKGK